MTAVRYDSGNTGQTHIVGELRNDNTFGSQRKDIALPDFYINFVHKQK